MKKILVPCDFSPQAVNAYQSALEIAERSKGEVFLLNVIELPVMHDTVLMPVLSFEEEFFKELKENSLKQFERITSKYSRDKVKVHMQVNYGATSRMILDFAKEQNIDLIVMGTKGASGLEEIFIGSNAEKIVRHATVPVLVIKENFKFDSIKSIVFPNTLHTEHQEDLVTKVKALQNFFNATLHVVYINTPTNFTRDLVTYERLKGFAKRFMLKDYTINIFNDPYEETGIINFAHYIKADLIALGTHGRKGLAHFLNGSVTEDVVNHVDSPIWTYSIK
jgi:nucleotide-binding universal stress UspA family protein